MGEAKAGAGEAVEWQALAENPRAGPASDDSSLCPSVLATAVGGHEDASLMEDLDTGC